MTTKNSTRNKLVGSMRKTKAIAGIGAGSTETGEETEVRQPAAERSKAVVGPSQPAPASADGYQCGRRVWPD